MVRRLYSRGISQSHELYSPNKNSYADFSRSKVVPVRRRRVESHEVTLFSVFRQWTYWGQQCAQISPECLLLCVLPPHPLWGGQVWPSPEQVCDPLHSLAAAAGISLTQFLPSLRKCRDSVAFFPRSTFAERGRLVWMRREEHQTLKCQNRKAHV